MPDLTSAVPIPAPADPPDLSALRRLLCGEGPDVWLKPGLSVKAMVELNRVIQTSGSTRCARYWDWLENSEERYKANLGSGRPKSLNPEQPVERFGPVAAPGAFGDLETIKANKSRKGKRRI